MVTLATEQLDGNVAGRRVAVLGASFKPNSDDVRDSPALDVAAKLRELGARVVVTDPEANANAKARQPELSFAESAEDAVVDADLVLLLTEWPVFVGLDPIALAQLVNTPRMLDGRNALDPATWRDAGWTYRALGRGKH
jgi:UDPglucose 6-dehydrogenase